MPCGQRAAGASSPGRERVSRRARGSHSRLPGPWAAEPALGQEGALIRERGVEEPIPDVENLKQHPNGSM